MSSERPLKDEDWGKGGPEVVEVADYVSPVDEEISVEKPADLIQEFDRLKGFLGSDLAEAWQTRMGCLQRFQTIVTQGNAVTFDNFLEAIDGFKEGLANQLADRRSKVVKETTVCLRIVTKALNSRKYTGEQHVKFVSVIKYFVQELFQTLPQTVRVISEAGKEGLAAVLENTADDPDHTLLRTLIEGARHTHPAIRESCLSGMAILLHKNRFKLNEKEKAVCAAAIKRKQEVAKAGEATETKQEAPADEEEPTMLSLLVEVLSVALNDSSGQARKAARTCVMEFHHISEVHGDKVIASMTNANRKSYDREVAAGKKGRPGKGPAKKTGGRTSLRARMLADRRRKAAKKESPALPAVVEAKLPSPPKKKRGSISPTKKRRHKKSFGSVSSLGNAGTPIHNAVLEKRKSGMLTDNILAAKLEEAAKKKAARVSSPSPDGNTRKIELVQQLLDLQNPQVTARMVDFLAQEDVVGILLSFISHFTTDEIEKIIASETKSISIDSHITWSGPGARQRSQTHQNLDEVTYTPDRKLRETISLDRLSSKDSQPASKDPTSLIDRHSSYSDDEKTMRRSYVAMKFMCEQNKNLMFILKKHLRTIIIHVLSCFYPTSKANFYHSCAVFSQMVRWFPSQVLKIILSADGRVLFRRVFDNLHEPPVGDAILHFLAAPSDDRDDKDTLFRMLSNKWKIVDVIARRICHPNENEETSSYNALFMQQALDRMAVAKHAVLLLSSICAPGSLVDSLITVICNEGSTHPRWQRLQCASLLGHLFSRSSPTDETEISNLHTPLNTPRMNGEGPVLMAKTFTDMFPVLVKTVLPHVPRICDALSVTSRSASCQTLSLSSSSHDSTMSITPSVQSAEERPISGTGAKPPGTPGSRSIQFSSYTVEQSFTKLRLSIMEILCEVGKGPKWCDTLVLKIAHSTWSVLVNWFFQYRHNSMYLNKFKTLFLYALRSTDPAAITFIMNDCNFVAHMISFYTSKAHRPCTVHSMILELCNHLRLTSQTSPNHYITGFLQEREDWKTFLPTLRIETAKQVVRLWNTPKKASRRHSDHHGTPRPVPFPAKADDPGDDTDDEDAGNAVSPAIVVTPDEKAASKTPIVDPDAVQTMPEDQLSALIDIGSKYADTLGYTEPKRFHGRAKSSFH